MATPMTPDQRLAAYKAEGLRVVEVPGWRTNDRAPVTGRAAGPKHGLVNHHTGGDTSNPLAYASGILSKGSSALVGPLCHDGLDPDSGTLYTVGTGRTNHAGGGDPAVLQAVTNDAVPYDRELKPTKGNTDGVDGNAPFYGLEVMYSGSRDLPRVGYVAMVRWNTAICRFHGWSGASAIAHREWSDDKPDPGHVSLPQLRRDVDAALALPPGVWGSTVAPPPPDTTGDDGMADLTENSKQFFRDLLDEMFRKYGTSGMFGAGDATNQARQLRNDGEALRVFVVNADHIDAPAEAEAVAPAFPSARAALPDCADADDPHNV